MVQRLLEVQGPEFNPQDCQKINKINSIQNMDTHIAK
jgi:hypothetical protein